MPKYQFDLEAIHADWPAYPSGHGQEYALETLCCFPQGTHFRDIDAIDECLLMVAVEYMDSNQQSSVHPNHFHVAVWEKDLRAMKNAGWASDFFTSDQIRQQHLANTKWMQPEHQKQAIESIESSAWEGIVESEPISLIIPDQGITVSPLGWSAVTQVMKWPETIPHFAKRVNALIDIELYDSAIREAAILLEMELCRRASVKKFGQALVNEYVNFIAAKAGQHGAFQRYLKGELRAFFKFIRNDFAHNIIELDKGRCYSLLSRALTIYEMLDAADRGDTGFQDIIFSSLVQHT
jgi:hypothetical protein